MFDQILVPTDGSDTARKVAETGIELAATTGAELHVIHILETRFPLDEFTDQLESKGRETANGFIEEIADDARSKGLSIETHIDQGVPYREILHYADTADIDLIVMGTHGRTGAKRYLLGSTTEKIVRLADTQVLTTHPYEQSRYAAVHSHDLGEHPD
jgi:nucleotide-binding universal stress UspA family protein